MDLPWYETVSLPALLRHARRPYGAAMRRALEAAGYDDIPKNGLYVLGALAIEGGHIPLSRIIEDLDLSKQAGGHLVDLLVMRGYLERQTDPNDRRQLIVTLTERGRDAARVQTEARQGIDAALLQRTSPTGMNVLRKMLAALIGIGREVHPSPTAASALHIGRAIPILFVRDVTASARFFADKLGFATDFLHGEPPFYGSVSRGGACVHLRHVGRPNFTELAAREEALILATIPVSDVAALHAEFVGRGVEIARGLVDQPWGGTDFHVRDPDGNEISFVQYHHQPSGDKAVETRNTFENRNMDEAHFDNCSMKQARFNNINLAASQFSDINMAGARFSDVNLSGVVIDDANIDGLTIFGHDIKALINAAQGQKA